MLVSFAKTETSMHRSIVLMGLACAALWAQPSLAHRGRDSGRSAPARTRRPGATQCIRLNKQVPWSNSSLPGEVFLAEK